MQWLVKEGRWEGRSSLFHKGSLLMLSLLSSLAYAGSLRF